MQFTQRKTTVWQRVRDWAGDRVAQTIWGGRTRHNPQRETQAYARLITLGNNRFMKDRPLIKPSPSNLRMFSRTVYARRAINAIKNPIVLLPWRIQAKRDVTVNAEIQRQIDVVTNCFRQPNSDDSFRTLLEQAIEDYLVAGAGVIEVEIGGDKNRPLWMWAADAQSIQIFAGWNGDPNEPRYVQSLGYGNVGGVEGIRLYNDQLIYIRKDPNTENPFGFGCLEIAFASINRKLGVEDYAGNVASNGQPENLIQMIGMDRVSVQAMRNFWQDEIEGQGMTPILGGQELKVHKLRGASDDALYLKYQDMLLREIATAFELSPQNLSLEADVNRNTSEVAEDRDWATAIVPTATNFEAYLNREAIERRLGFSQIEFAFEGIERDDELNLAKIFEIEYKANATTPNEYLAARGRQLSENKWADSPCADVEIAIKGAQGAKQINPDLIEKE